MDKQALREWVWRELEARKITTFPKPARGRIPNFVGSGAAAALLRSLPTYDQARTIFVNPDAAQLAVRELALRDGKHLIMATPRLREGFILLDPAKVKDARKAASIRGAFKHGGKTRVHGLRVDLIVEGSVAVDRRGGRVGKGGGFGDLEFAILRETKGITDTTPIVTTVHPLQIVDEIPMSEHDVPVDFIVTPDRIIETTHAHPKPPGIIWELLPSDALKRMPILSELKTKR
ncbi:MAG: 5-formyltetrahydrofolate cyclo-ligase [Candidatus Hadarchaeaceae archaeon]